MIVDLFTWLSGTLSDSGVIAFAGAFIWGVLSILLSPCHLASIPLIVGFISGQGVLSIRRSFTLAFLFSTGILITIGIIGLITGLMGRMLGDIGKWGTYFVAIIFFIVGLHLFSIIPLPFFQKEAGPDFQKKGFFAAFLLGLIFGVALGPCSFAFMAPLLGIAFSAASTKLLFAVSLILAYAAGHCSVIIFAGTFTEAVQGYLNRTERSRSTMILKKICGVLVMAGGIYLVLSV